MTFMEQYFIVSAPSMLENVTLIIVPETRKFFGISYSLRQPVTFDLLLVTMMTNDNTTTNSFEFMRSDLNEENYVQINQPPPSSAVITLKLTSHAEWSKPTKINFTRPSMPTITHYNHTYTQNGLAKINIYLTIDYKITEKLRVTFCASNLIECKQSLHSKEERLQQIVEIKEKAVGECSCAHNCSSDTNWNE